MKAVRVVRHPCGAVDEVSIQGSPEAINELVEQGWEIEYSWTAMDYVSLIGWCLFAIVGGVGVAAVLGGLITPGP